MACLMSIGFTAHLLHISRLRRCWYYAWIKIIQIVILIYVGVLYSLAFLGLSSSIFPSSAVAMEFFRPGILLLVITILLDSVWQYRAEP
jgi:hypothetical protein